MEDVKSLIPAPKAEDWRYADLTLVRTKALPLAETDGAKGAVSSVTKWPVIAFVNGEVVAKPDGLKGVEISQAPDVPALDHPLARLAVDHATCGVKIRVAKGANIEGLEILFHESGDEGARHIANMIVLEDGATAGMVLRFSNQRASGWINAATAVSLGKSAELTLYGDFDAGEATLTSTLTRGSVSAGARLDVFNFGLGLPSLRSEIEVALDGPGAQANLSGGLLAAHGETVDVVTRITHASGHAMSKQTFRGVAGNGGTTAFQGRVTVAEDAQKTEAHQTCHNLILEDGGEANVKPELLIFADDVVCSHGATVGEIDETSLFYLMQRGIPEMEARAILVEAFLGDVLEPIENETLKEHFAGRIAAWMKKNLEGAGS